MVNNELIVMAEEVHTGKTQYFNRSHQKIKEIQKVTVGERITVGSSSLFNQNCVRPSTILVVISLHTSHRRTFSEIVHILESEIHVTTGMCSTFLNNCACLES